MTEFLVLRTWRIILSTLLVAMAATALALGIGARIGPALGYELFAIRSGSMEPAIGVGALTIVDRSRPPRAGEVVTYRLPSGTAVTHRVVRVVEMDDQRWLEARGDANATPDPALIPADAVIGVVATRIAYLGYFLALLAMPSGIVSLVAFGAMLLLAVWIIEGAEANASDRRLRRRQGRTRIIDGSRAPAH